MATCRQRMARLRHNRTRTQYADGRCTIRISRVHPSHAASAPTRDHRIRSGDLVVPFKKARRTHPLSGACAAIPPYDSVTTKHVGFEYDITRGVLRHFSEAPCLLVSRTRRTRKNDLLYCETIDGAAQHRQAPLQSEPPGRPRLGLSACADPPSAYIRIQRFYLRKRGFTRTPAGRVIPPCRRARRIIEQPSMILFI